MPDAGKAQVRCAHPIPVFRRFGHLVAVARRMALGQHRAGARHDFIAALSGMSLHAVIYAPCLKNNFPASYYMDNTCRYNDVPIDLLYPE